MKREKVVVRRKNDASGQRLECVQIRQSAQKQRTATQTAQTILVGGIRYLVALLPSSSSREAPKFPKVEPSNAKYRVLHKLRRPSVFLSKSLHLRVTCYPVSFRRDLQALVERQIILQSHARLNLRMPLPRIS